MGIGHKILTGKVMHGRLFPKKNRFVYGIYYLALNVSDLESLPCAYNRFGLLSFYDKDHGRCDGSALEPWAREILKSYGLEHVNGEIMLVCMPRIFGYVFNPVSFWLCHDEKSDLRAVLCEVNNTFGERHTYVCAREDGGVIGQDDLLYGQKVFHVSPLLEREGSYRFRFAYNEKSFGAFIDYFDEEGREKLVTSLVGQFEDLSSASLKKVFWRYPLIPFKAIVLIHWQAAKLLSRGIRYIRRPKQMPVRVSGTKNLTKIS